MLDEQPMNEAFKVFFQDQLLALIKSNPHGVRTEHLLVALRPLGYMSFTGQMRQLEVPDLLGALKALCEDGKVSCADLDYFMSAKTVWVASNFGMWTEFDDFEASHHG